MNISQIKYALKVVETKNFSKAAEELFISQPSLSQQISKLEDTLNTKLFKRTTKNFEITEAGKAFYEKGKAVINAIENLEKEMMLFQKSDKKKLRIGILPTLSKMGFTKKIVQFSENKNVELEFIEDYSENLLLMILNKKIDVALVNRIVFYEKEEQKMLDYINLLVDEIVIIAPKKHRFEADSNVKIEDIINEPIIKLPENSSITKYMKNEFENYHINPRFVYECKNISTLIDLVDEGMGISFLSERVARKYISENTKIIKLRPRISSTMAIVALKDKKESPLLKKFYNELI